jgi:hypothetical protein
MALRPVRQRYSYSVPSPHSLLKIPAQATWAGGIESLESIPELLKRLQIRALFCSVSVSPVRSVANMQIYLTCVDEQVVRETQEVQGPPAIAGGSRVYPL